VPSDLRPTVAVSLVFASMTGLLACPQLLSDDFDAVQSTGDDGCAGRLACAPGGAGGSSGAGGTAAGSGGTTSGSGGSTSNAGASGSAGVAGSGGSSTGGNVGTGGTGGSGGSDPADAAVDPPEPPACWLVELDDTTHAASGNCLGVNGWNQVVTDETTDTVVNLSYEDDRVCFSGTVVNEGWGATYNFTLNDEEPWGSEALDVGGFQLDAEGLDLPPQMRVIYTDADDGDYCRVVTPGAAVQVPFASAHPGCSTSSSSVPDPDDLTYIRLAILPAASDYAVDFCLEIRAIP
jgi:hypothetical protein